MRFCTGAIITALALLLLFAACTRRAVEGSQRDLDPTNTQLTTIEVVVRGIRSHEGQILLALFTSPDGFPGDTEKAMHRMKSLIEGDEVTFTISRIPPGPYAISVLHDENANNRMETDFLGRPKEGHGFSRNARGRFGPPGFDDAIFRVTGVSLELQIDLRY
ncbi:MAG: DUF2141 domain-containing protein [Candidatus Latescibacterota bacterium]|nr:MAG: DUF2141 domain-containing protein [Candidatus Latescibacterota bacterium]